MITGKVAYILDNRTVAFNIGKDVGVKRGMIFQIFSRDGQELVDPDTGASIGNLKVPKIKVKVSSIDKKFSIAETFEYENVNIGGVNTLYNTSKLFSSPKYIRKFKTFELEETQKKKLSEAKSIIKIGDIAEEVADDLPF